MWSIAEGGLRQVLRWQTDVLESYSGNEQRIRVAALPRVSYAGALHLDEADLAYARALVATSPAAAFNLPIPCETVASLAPITADEITIDPTYADWAVADQLVYVRGPAGDAYTATIDSVAGPVLTLDTSVPAGTFPAHLTTVTPVEPLWLEDGQPFGRWPRAAGRWEFAGRQVTARALGGTGAPAITTLGGLDVLDRRPVVDGLAGEAIAAGVRFQDAGGAVASSAAFTRAKPRRTFSWLIKGSAEWQWWKAWLARREGRRTIFRAPTWRPDLKLTTYTAGTDKLRIDATHADYLGQWWPSLAHRAIQLEMSDGTFQRRTVSGVIDVGGDVQELTVNAVLTGAPADVVQVCFLEQARLDTDDVTITWGANMVGRVTLPVVVVQG